MADIVTDISVNKNWQARKGYHNPFTFTFTNNASAFNISGYTFSLQVRRFGSTTNLINLTQGSGLTNGGATGVLTGQINAAATSSMSANEYYWQLTVVQPDTFSYVLFNGTFVLHDETYTGSLTSAISVAVNLTGSDVDVTVTLVGGSSISFEDEGVSLGTAGTVDFVGAGVTATKSGDKVTVTIPGGAGVSGSGTTNQIAYWTGATSLGALTTATYPSLTELSYVKGVTSSIQTQLDAKMPLSGTATLLGTLDIDADGYAFNVTNAEDISLAATTQISLTSGLNYFSSTLNQFTGGNVGLDVGAYINWGTTYGSSGYGIRDNAGTMEFKNNAGSWTAFGSGGGGITIGTTTITSGSNTRVLFNNAGVVGEYTISGTGNVAMTTNPVFTTPNLGTPSAATLTNATGYLLNSIAAATGSNTINNSANAQEWQWNSLGSGNGLYLTSTSTAAASNTQTLFNIALSGANSTSTQTTYGARISNSHTGTSSTNYALQVSASGGTTNYGLGVLSGGVLLNQGAGQEIAKTGGILTISTGGDSFILKVGSTNAWLLNGSTGGHIFTPIGGATNISGQFTFGFGGVSRTNQAASTELINTNFAANTITFQTGAIATQRNYNIAAPTYAFNGASTITNAYTFYVGGGPTAGANATITNAWSAGFGGNVSILDSLVVNSTSKSANTGSGVIIIDNAGTNASGAQANGIVLHSRDSSDAAATLALYLEQAVETIGTFTASHKVKVWINGTEYWISLDAVL